MKTHRIYIHPAPAANDADNGGNATLPPFQLRMAPPRRRRRGLLAGVMLMIASGMASSALTIWALYAIGEALEAAETPPPTPEKPRFRF